MHKSEKNTYSKTFHQNTNKKKADNNTFESYAIENGHKNQTKNKKYKNPNKDLQQKHTYPHRGRKPSNNNGANNDAARRPMQRALDTTTRSMRRLMQLRTPNFVPVLVVLIKTDRDKFHPVMCLVDSGSSHSFLRIKSLPNAFRQFLINTMIKEPNAAGTRWQTRAGYFNTTGTANIRFMMPEFTTKPKFEYLLHLDTSESNTGSPYDMVIGREFLQELGMNIKFSSCETEFEGATVPMRDRNSLQDIIPTLKDQATFESFESEASQALVSRMTRILESKYEPADLNKVVENCKNLTSSQKSLLLRTLKQHEPLFDGKLGAWKMAPVKITLKDQNVKPYHARAYTIPKIYEDTVKREIAQLVQRKVLKQVNRSEWAAPTFIVPKKLNPGETTPKARVVSDFRKLNECLVRHPYPVPTIQHTLQTLEGFMYGTSLDLVQGYYQMPLDDASKKKCTIVLPWGKYEYQVLPMGICVAGDVFQERMNELLGHLPFVRCYIDDILIITKGSWEEHCQAIDTVCKLLAVNGLKVNAMKSFFGQTELEYLGFIVNRKGVRPVPNKVEAIKAILPPTNRKQLRRFIGMINFYKEIWPGRSKMLAPLTRLTSKNVPFKWTEVEQKAFDEIKRKITKDTMLTYPNFNKPFDVHTDASDKQIGAVISQEGKPVAHFSRTLNSAQKNYTVTDKELLSIVEVLKEYRSILYGHAIRVYTDHKNLTHSNTQTVSQRIMRWRLVIEEFGIELIYIKGEHNIAADALSRLPRSDVDVKPTVRPSTDEIKEMNEISNSISTDDCPINYQLIEQEQRNNSSLQRILNAPTDKDPKLNLSPFVGGGKSVQLITNAKGLIIVPPSLQKKLVNWYHERLGHPGRDRLYESIYQHFDWPKPGQLRNTVQWNVKTCPICQKAKKTSRHYGQLPAKQVETKPWETLHVDLYGPKTIKRKDGTKLKFQVMTMIDPVTGWFEMKSYDDGTPETITNLLEIAWLNRYPRPHTVIADRGGEFVGQFFEQNLREEYGIKLKLITTANPQANAVVERVHQVIGNMLRAFDLEDCYLLPPPFDPLEGIISAISFAIRSTWSTTMRATPGQLVFGRDMLLNIKHVVDWHYMQTRRQRIASENNARENARRVPHEYKVGDKVLKAHGNPSNKKEISSTLQRPFEGPYEITNVWNNGTVTIRRTVRGGAVFERINIRRIRPYHEE